MIKKLKITLIFFCLAAMQSLVAQSASSAKEPAKEEDEFAKKKIETKLMEVIPTDSVGPADLLKRASKWMKAEAPLYKISGVGTSASNAECTASFPVKPKEINPQIDFTGKITMKVRIECKAGKYRYTISEIKHISKSGDANGGSVDNVVPECGSMSMADNTWKKLKGEALRCAGIVANDLKNAMGVIATEEKAEEW
ncbi:MAG: hypothetical protein PSX36_14330 [bacterium]|nr:hypothetical protein [bacterium]